MRRHYRFGLKFMLATVLLAALILGWVVPEQRRADEKTALVAELTGVGVRPDLRKSPRRGASPNGGEPPRVQAVAALSRFGSGWFDRPTVFVCARWRTNRSLMPSRSSGVWGPCGRSTPRVPG